MIFQLSFCIWSMRRTIDSAIDFPRLPVEMPLPPDSNKKHACRKAPFQRTSPSNLRAGTTRGKSREINIAINRSAHALVVETELENHWTAHTDLHYRNHQITENLYAGFGISFFVQAFCQNVFSIHTSLKSDYLKSLLTSPLRWLYSKNPVVFNKSGVPV